MIVEEGDARQIGDDEGNEEGKETEDTHLAQILAQALKVHLQSCEEDDIEQTDAPEEFEGGVALQDIEPVLTDENTRQHHADDVGDTQFAHNDGSYEDDEKHYEKCYRRTAYG